MLMSVSPCFAAVTYPEGVTQQTSQQAAEKTDVLLEHLMQSQNTSISKTVKDMLYADSTLSQILLLLYTQMENQSSSVSSLGLDVSPKTAAACLAAYPEVASVLEAAESWSTVNLDGARWFVSSDEGFCEALAAVFSPFNDALYMILCGGTYKAGLINLAGGDGYSNGIVPMLSAFGCTQITDSQQFKAQADADRNSMMRNIVSSLLSMVNYVLISPAVRLSELMPNIAHYIKNGGFENSVNALMDPLKVGIGPFAPLFKGTTMLSVLSFIQNPGEGVSNFGENFTIEINLMIPSSAFQIADLDLETLASCGTLEGDRVKADIGQSFSVIFAWLIDTLKLNKDKVTSMLGENEQMKEYSSVITKLFDKETDKIFSLFVKLLTAESGTDSDYQWQAKPFTPGAVTYTQNLGKEKYQRVVDGFDELLEEIVKENTDEKNLKTFMKKTIYSPDVIDSLVLGLYGQLADGEMSDALDMIGLSVTPSGVANKLTESQFSSARYTLYRYSSFKNIKAGTINWGFSAGDKKGFERTLTAVLRPFEDALRMLLVSGKIEFMGAVNLCGSNGYNNAVIPLLEALGCDSKDIMSYDQYKKNADGDGVISNLLTPIFSLLDKVCKRPAYTLLDIVPNILFFVSNGSLIQCLENLTSPFTSLLSELSISMKDLGFDLDEFKSKDLLGEISKSAVKMVDDIKLTSPDLTKLSNLGTAETRTSKATYNGTAAQYTYIKSDQTAVLITVLRYFVEILKDPANSSLMSGFMGGGESAEGETDMFAQYSSGITDQMASMTTDETIEWLYKLFFRERAVKSAPATDNYSTAIKYVAPKEDHTGTIIRLLIVLAVLAVIVIISRKRIARFFIILKENRDIKKRQNEKEKMSIQTDFPAEASQVSDEETQIAILDGQAQQNIAEEAIQSVFSNEGVQTTSVNDSASGSDDKLNQQEV